MSEPSSSLTPPLNTVNERSNQLNERLNQLNERIDGLENRLENRQGRIEDRLKRIEYFQNIELNRSHCDGSMYAFVRIPFVTEEKAGDEKLPDLTNVVVLKGLDAPQLRSFFRLYGLTLPGDFTSKNLTAAKKILATHIGCSARVDS